ncbi:restriction endonuclease subunit S [Candidatus Pelagibacter sp.]|nr:restriction endonuclease subunit S [Candidatus Pelagibacter sp.]
MLNNLKEYKTVDSYWFDKVPYHWKKTKNKFVFNQNKHVVGEDWKRLTLLTMGKLGVKPRNLDGGGKFPANFENYQTVEPNQLIFCLFDLDETPRTIGISKDYGMITSAYDVFSTTKSNDPNFWTYFYQMLDDKKGLRPFYTGLRKVVRSETFMGIEVFSPPLEEQKLISRYLDKKTEQIDKLIDKIQKKIELLKEQRTSLINQCVTKGLNPNIEMKDSGVEWIGKMPKHWNIKKLKYVSNQISQKRLPVDGDIKISPENVESGTGEITNYYSDYDTEGQIFQSGDILFNKLRVYLSKVVLCDFDGLSMGEMIIIRPVHVISNFLHKILSSNGLINHVNSLSEGVKLPRPSVSGILDTFLPIPPEDEQVSISEYIQTKLRYIDLVITKYSDKIELMQEYRQSIIFSVVTGKVRISKDMI